MAARMMAAGSIFQSFWMGGFECSDQINCFGERVDLLQETEHVRMLESDYRRLVELGITTVREGIQWTKVERAPFDFDFTRVGQMMDTARRMGIQQVWDLCHFGYPDDLSPLHPKFTERFVALCRAFGRFVVDRYGPAEMVLTPINEVSFISWLGGEAAATVPFCRNEGWNIKYRLMEAYIRGIKVLKEINPAFRILSTEPLVSMVPGLNATDEEVLRAQASHELQYQVVDILLGRMCPELGGSPELLDVIGLNYYYNNQWEFNSLEGHFLPWANENEDPRWRPLSSLLEEVHDRYQQPIMLAETSHSGEDRPHWIRFVAGQCSKVLQQGISFLGICIYPVIDRPDWDHLHNWHHSGVWDHHPESGLTRILQKDYAAAIRESMKLVDKGRM
jgi:hypothetical protein